MTYKMIAHKLQQASQFFPPKPAFTETNLPDLKDKVYIVTGANTGVGKELAQMLYSKNARVYVAARNRDKAEAAMSDIRQKEPSSSGHMEFLALDLADLTTIKASAQQFLDKETKLHVLFNNAGVMQPPKGSTTKQGYELQLGVNNIGTYMFTKLLTPVLASTAKAEPVAGTVRVVWVASSAAEVPLFVPKGGVNLENIDKQVEASPLFSYFSSKAGNVLHAQEYARRHTEQDGIVSVPLNPGNLDSELWRTQTAFGHKMLRWTILHPSKNGAYTELFAGLSPEVTVEKSGQWIGPWGRFLRLKSDMVDAAKTKEEGGNGRAKEFTDWTEEQIKQYL